MVGNHGQNTRAIVPSEDPCKLRKVKIKCAGVDITESYLEACTRDRRRYRIANVRRDEHFVLLGAELVQGLQDEREPCLSG